MGQYLDCGRGGVLGLAGGTKLGTDLVRARNGPVSRQRSLGEIAALLGGILDESSRVKIRLRHIDVEDAVAG